jgi:hypothetical protein
MAAKMANRAKGRKAVSRAKATRKSTVQKARTAPKVGRTNFPPEYIEIF